MDKLIQNLIDINTNKLSRLQAIDKPKVGWLSIYTPEEIFYAAGIIPFRITGETASNTLDAGALLSQNFCSYVLSCLNEAVDGAYNFMDGIIFVDSCDTRKRLYETWYYTLQPKYSFFLELPKAINPISRDYFRFQITKLITSIEKHFKLKITTDSLHDAICLYNKNRTLLQSLYDLRKAENSRISGSQALSIVKSSTSGFKEEVNIKLVELIDKLKADKDRGGAIKHRVLIHGSYFDNIDIVNVIEKYGGSVVCEDISNGIKYIEGQVDENTDPICAIADYYYDKTSCARVIDTDRRLVRLFNLIKEYNIESVIYIVLKFCDTNLVDYPYIRHKLAESNIPVLFIETEQHMTNIENIKTRIMTFLESRIH